MGLQEGQDRAPRERTLGGMLDGGAISIRASLAGGWEQGGRCRVPRALWWSSCCPSRRERPKDVLRMERREKRMRQLPGKSSKPRSPPDRDPPSYPSPSTHRPSLRLWPQPGSSKPQTASSTSTKHPNPQLFSPPRTGMELAQHQFAACPEAGITPAVHRAARSRVPPVPGRVQRGAGLTWDAGGLRRSLPAAWELDHTALEPTQGGGSGAVREKGAILKPRGSGWRAPIVPRCHRRGGGDAGRDGGSSPRGKHRQELPALAACTECSGTRGASGCLTSPLASASAQRLWRPRRAWGWRNPSRQTPGRRLCSQGKEG